MKKVLLVLAAGAAVLCAGVPDSRADSAAPLKQLHGHVPAIVSQLPVKGNVPSGQTLHLAIGLPLRNSAELTNLLGRIYDPASPDYGHYLTPEQFTEKFGPTREDYQMVVNFARANGLTVTKTHSNRMLLDVSGRAADVEKAFNVNLNVYPNPSGNGDFFAPDSEPSVSSLLPVLDVGGLDSFRKPHPLVKVKSGNIHSTSRPGGAPKAGTGPGGLYMGDDFRNAYVPGAALKGSGQTIALVQFDGYLSNDIVQYEGMTGRTNIPLQNVLIDGFNGLPTGNGGEVEVSLDIEMSVSMGPALAKIILYEGDPFNFHPNDVLNAIATDDSARQISCSWGWTGGPTATTDQIFQQMALQGQTFFVASGDVDAYPPGTVDSPFNFGTPADSAFVTSVGGTTLTMNGAGASYSSEVVWNWGTEFGFDGVGSSGGYSSFYSIPSWQTNINMTARGGSATTRNFPDVALTADNVLVIADGGIEYFVGGTSCASPLWAGFIALANQQATNNAHASMGFLNPAVYGIANSSLYTNCFHDITVGNNEWSGSPTMFTATTNYDLCTGLGSPNGTNLINALTSGQFTNSTITHLSPPLPPYGYTLSQLDGGNPNGSWQLFVLDDQPLTGGVISNGWLLTLVTADPVGFVGDLALGMTASATNVVLGDTVVFTLSVTNYGPSTSSNVLVSDTLPLNTVIVSTNADMGTVTRGGQTLNWRVGTLATNTGSQLAFTLQLNNSGPQVNFAITSADTPDANTGNNTAFVDLNVVVPTPPVIGGFTNNNGSVSISVTSPPLPTIIQASTNLIDWTSIYTNTPPFVFTDPQSANYPVRFYRAIIQ